MSFDQKRTWGPTPSYPTVLAAKECANYCNANGPLVLAGPCSVETWSPEQMLSIAKALNEGGATYARGGVYRAGTYPRQDGVFGLQHELVGRWSQACRDQGLRVILEVLDVRQVAELAPWCDAFQVGARHMQDYALLKELATYDRVVTLKRNPGSTMDEFLGAAEYLARGRCTPILIERGSATHMNHVRWDLSISLIAAVKRMTGLPILVDASHGTGRRDLVEDMTLAGAAAGADGFLVEVHPDPERSLSDADQALPLDELKPLIFQAKAVQVVVRG